MFAILGHIFVSNQVHGNIKKWKHKCCLEKDGDIGLSSLHQNDTTENLNAPKQMVLLSNSQPKGFWDETMYWHSLGSKQVHDLPDVMMIYFFVDYICFFLTFRWSWVISNTSPVVRAHVTHTSCSEEGPSCHPRYLISASGPPKYVFLMFLIL